MMVRVGPLPAADGRWEERESGWGWAWGVGVGVRWGGIEADEEERERVRELAEGFRFLVFRAPKGFFLFFFFPGV